MNSGMKGWLAALALAAAADATAQGWTALGPDRGGEIFQLAIETNQANIVYALGGYGLYRSHDGGVNWDLAGQGLAGSFLLGASMASDGDLPGIVYLFQTDGRLMRSVDYGLSFVSTGYATPVPQQALLLVDEPGSNGVLYAAMSGGGVYKSMDSGASFQPISASLPADRRLARLAIDPADPQHLLAGTAMAQPDGDRPTLFQSHDGGITWSSIAIGNGAYSASDIRFYGGGKLVAIVDERLYVSADSGQTWTQSGGGSFWGMSLAAVPADPPQQIAANGAGCWRSTDFFSTLQSCGGGLVAAGRPSATLVTARQWLGGYSVLQPHGRDGVLSLHENMIHWYPENAGLLAENLRGLALHPADPQVLYTGRWMSRSDHDPLLRSIDGGSQWQASLGAWALSLRSFEIDPTRAAALDSTTVYAAGRSRFNSSDSRSGVFKSVDGGAQWTPLDRGLPVPDLSFVKRRIVLDPRSCADPPLRGPCTAGPLRTLYVLTSDTEAWSIMKSTEGGDNWQAAGDGLLLEIQRPDGGESLVLSDLEFDSADSTLYLSTIGYYYNDDGSTIADPVIASGVFRSSDGGANWTQASNGLPRVGNSVDTVFDVPALAVHPRRSGWLWAATNTQLTTSRIYRSRDGGAHWEASGAELPGCDVRDLRIDPASPQVIYAAGGALQGNGCVFRSEDGGDSWTALHAQLPVGAVWDLRIAPADQRRLYIAGSHGIWSTVSPPDRLFEDTGL